MAIADPHRVLDKFGKLHSKLGGTDRVLQFVLFTNAVTDYWSAPAGLAEYYTPTNTGIVKDQPDEDMVQAFGGGIGRDQRLFIFTADSLVPRLPLATLSVRSEDFLTQRSGQSKGGILYGNTVYTIDHFIAKPIIGTVAARYIILGTAQKKEGG